MAELESDTAVRRYELFAAAVANYYQNPPDVDFLIDSTCIGCDLLRFFMSFSGVDL